MARKSHFRPGVQGAFGLQSRHTYQPNAPSETTVHIAVSAPHDDGVPYERLAKPIRERFTELKDIHSEISWFATSPFMAILLKEMIRYLYARHGFDGLKFLDGLGLETLADLDLLDEMSGSAIIELFALAMAVISKDDQQALGLIEAAA